MQHKSENFPASIHNVTFNCASLQDIPMVEVGSALAEFNIVRISGLFPRDEIRSTHAHIARHYNPQLDQKHDPSDVDSIRTNFQKLQIGSNSGLNSLRTLGRFMRVIYNPIFCEDVLNMRQHFIQLTQLRNLLYGLPRDFTVHDDEAGFWTCSRIQNYPSGGGFMVPHRDQYSQIATVESGLDYYQLLLLLTEKGTDYQQGGAYVQNHESRFDYESDCAAGDVIIYNGKSIHGVADIDPLTNIDFSKLTGRSVAIASLFKVLSKSDDYAKLAERSKRLKLS